MREDHGRGYEAEFIAGRVRGRVAWLVANTRGDGCGSCCVRGDEGSEAEDTRCDNGAWRESTDSTEHVPGRAAMVILQLRIGVSYHEPFLQFILTDGRRKSFFLPLFPIRRGIPLLLSPMPQLDQLAEMDTPGATMGPSDILG